ncbi:MAG: aromatic ring-hydroxylating dioxygenase subunit alpha, partial [Pseudomonadota bacterium]
MNGGAMRDAWYPVGLLSALTSEGRESLLLGEPIEVIGPASAPKVIGADGRSLPTIQRFGHVWTSLGEPGTDLFTIPEIDHPDRTLVDVGVVRVKCSPLRAVENFLDIAHFPFVHTDILGDEAHPEVKDYRVEIREDTDEVWATKVAFYQPQAAKSAGGGLTTEYMYRVPAPTSAVLYKTCDYRVEIREDTDEVWATKVAFYQPQAA